MEELLCFSQARCHSPLFSCRRRHYFCAYNRVYLKTWPATKTERDLFSETGSPLKILMNAIFVFILIILPWFRVLVGSVFITPVVATLVNIVIYFILVGYFIDKT